MSAFVIKVSSPVVLVMTGGVFAVTLTTCVALTLSDERP